MCVTRLSRAPSFFSSPPRTTTTTLEVPGGGKAKSKKLGKTKQQGSKPVLWVDLFRCFNCQTEGRSPPLRKCTQCEVAYYCGKDCQRAHWKLHKPACIAAVAAKAQDAARQRLARAVREKGKEKVEGAKDDDLCVICFSPPVDPVEVRECGCASGRLGCECEAVGGRCLFSAPARAKERLRGEN